MPAMARSRETRFVHDDDDEDDEDDKDDDCDYNGISNGNGEMRYANRSGKNNRILFATSLDPPRPPKVWSTEPNK
jgi:hypothetical protein